MADNLNIKLTAKSLFVYALPMILSNIFANVYGLVDSIFVANLVGINALSAVNIVSPFLAVSLAVGTMLGTGGSAIVAKLLGEGKTPEARADFTMFFVTGLLVSSLFLVFGIIFQKQVLFLLGADETVYEYCRAYALPIFLSVPFMCASIILQIFLNTNGKPSLSFALSLLGGGSNIVLDYLFIKTFDMGVAGAAIATGAGYVLQTLVGAAYFIFARKGLLRFSKFRFGFKTLTAGFSNGASEMVSMLAVSVTMIAMNNVLMRLSGADGVAAATVVLSAQSLFSAVYMGYAEGVAPLVGYNYGKANEAGLKQIFKNAMLTIGALSVLAFASAFPLARPVAKIFSDGSPIVENLAVKGIFFSASAFLFMGFNIFASSMFTAFGDGKTSAVLAFFRTFVFLIVPLVTLPHFFGVSGVWISLPTAEICSIIISCIYLLKKRGVYRYA